MRALYFRPVVSASFFLFFSSPNLSRRRLDVYHTSTRCGLCTNLECMSEMWCTQLAENTGPKKSPSYEHHPTTLSGYIFAINARIDNRKIVKQQYLLHISPQYGELRPTNGWDRFGSSRHHSKFQSVSRLRFVTAPTSLNGGHQNFAGCLALSCASTLYIHFWGSCRLAEFFQLQSSLCVQVLRSPILAALLHGTRAAAVSQTSWHGTTYIRLGVHHVGHRPTF